MKLELKGIISYVGEIQNRKSGFKTREIVLTKNYVDDFGTAKRSIYPMQIVGDDINRINPVHNDRVTILAYLNGQEYEGRFYLSLRVKSITSQS